MWTAVAAGIGLLTTILAWFLNPARRRLDELFRIEDELIRLNKKRDKALNEKSNYMLTVVNNDIIELLSRRNKILQRQR